MNPYDLTNIDIKAKCPPEGTTDEQWQKYFIAMKSLVAPIKEKKMTITRCPTVISSIHSDDNSKYDDVTNWYRYCQFINTILTAIRKGEVDYCFHVYQIADLLKYEYDRLRTKWVSDDQYFQVWLADN